MVGGRERVERGALSVLVLDRQCQAHGAGDHRTSGLFRVAPIPYVPRCMHSRPSVAMLKFVDDLTCSAVVAARRGLFLCCVSCVITRLVVAPERRK